MWGQNTPMGLCDQISGIGGYNICYELALQRAEMNFVVEVFSAKCQKKRRKVRRGLWFCNVANKAALHIPLRLKASIGNGFQHFVTL